LRARRRAASHYHRMTLTSGCHLYRKGHGRGATKSPSPHLPTMAPAATDSRLRHPWHTPSGSTRYVAGAIAGTACVGATAIMTDRSVIFAQRSLISIHLGRREASTFDLTAAGGPSSLELRRPAGRRIVLRAGWKSPPAVFAANVARARERPSDSTRRGQQTR
jgi:hypothetical protein